MRALGELFDRTAPRLLRLAMHLSSQAADAEDLVQLQRQDLSYQAALPVSSAHW